MIYKQNINIDKLLGHTIFNKLGTVINPLSRIIKNHSHHKNKDFKTEI